MTSLLKGVVAYPPEEIRTEFLVVGSGPGGSIAATLLAEAGREVLAIEEGPFLPLESAPAFSRQEMLEKYRNGGLTVALGKTKVAYVEGRCVGGGSEINSGLYHRPPPDVLDEWRRSHQVESLEEDDLRPHCEANERDLCVSRLPGSAPRASLKLHEGATQLGWRSLEVPRWFRYGAVDASASSNVGVKQSMTKTFVPRALAAGIALLPETRATRLARRGAGWVLTAEFGVQRRRVRIIADKVFIACGAIQTPALLLRSGLGRHVGDSLHLHPTAKVVARFSEDVNESGMGVPVHQVKEFAPKYSFGCSISAPPHLSLALLDHPDMLGELETQWRSLAIYYAMTRGGVGSVRTIPFFHDALVRYRLNDDDLAELTEGLRKLCQCLFAAGAVALYPTGSGSRCLIGNADSLTPAACKNLMTIHLFSSCPMGEDRRRCVTDSFGRVHGEKNLWIVDGSVLPGPPGVNPQGTIMAIARRNIQRFLEQA